MPKGHDKLSRAEAAVCRWVPVRPTDDQLSSAQAPATREAEDHVKGPHLRCVRKSSRSNIGVVGISKGLNHRYGREEVVFYVNLGSTCYTVHTKRIGISEAFRRALEIRRRWESKVEAANQAILQAREANREVSQPKKGRKKP